jgi:hypothetical protein
MDIYLVSPSGVELNLNSFGASSSHFVNEYPKGAFDIAPVEHISRYTADGLPYLDTYRRRPIVVDLKLTAVGSTAGNLWSEIVTILAQARMSKTPCKLKVVESGKTVYLDVHPESSAVIPSVLSSDITLRLVSYGRWYSGTLRTETLTTRASQTVSYIAVRSATGWSAVGGGINGTIDTIAVAQDGAVYIGGYFTTAGESTVNYIAKWNGTAWSALGTGMNGTVRALAIGTNGALYAGGDFTTAGGVTVNYVAKWNGSTWSALGTGMSSNVYAIAVSPDGSLYAGGLFSTAGGVTTNGIAKWNGSTWSALGTGTNGTVNTIVVSPDGGLYVGGNFTTAGGITANKVAKWSGSAWSAMGLGMNSTVYAMAIGMDGVVYAGGYFSIADGVTTAHIAKWDGSSWGGLGGGMDNTVYATAVASDGTLYAGGFFSVAGDTVLADRITLWNGYRWLPIDIDLPGAATVYSVVYTGDGKLYLGFTTSGTAASSAINTITAVTSDVYPQLKITASTAATVQYIENQTIGKHVWLSYNMLPGETLTLDFSQATATSSAWGNVLRAVAPGSDMKFSLTKGTNSVWLFVPTGTVTAQLSWYPQYETLAEALQ